ncbi:hypothetical protein HZH68_001697 [Vespula germanica]|uniref:Uncharacterized protein n=1 Tax=Vespula germanica TaxID=30212 RepID=A0A834U6Z2_VESGE|nr:hypothetical protein HZH68_001697 [Vespula germanica]
MYGYWEAGGIDSHDEGATDHPETETPGDNDTMYKEERKEEEVRRICRLEGQGLADRVTGNNSISSNSRGNSSGSSSGRSSKANSRKLHGRIRRLRRRRRWCSSSSNSSGRDSSGSDGGGGGGLWWWLQQL